MSPEVVSPARKVWVLMFDQLRTEDADVTSTQSSDGMDRVRSPDSVYGPLDDLDFQSSFFEQYMLQDARNAATATDVLGGIEAVRRFNARMSAANKTAGTVRLLCVSGSSGETPVRQPIGNLLSASETSKPCVERTIPALGSESGASDESVFHNDRELGSSLTADLVWIEAKNGVDENSQANVGRILQIIQRLRCDTMLTSSVLPVLIVSSVHGYVRELASPFTSGLSESQIHVPLWIEHGASHACRIQALTGSFDILPTLVEYLTGTRLAPDDSAPSMENSADATMQFSGRPMSLVSACEHHKPLPDRLLHLTGDSWSALRTQQYLLVHPEAQKDSSCDSAASPDETSRAVRRLYLKPDDVWNVNDAVVSYAEIANQMEAAAAESAGNTGASERIENAGHDSRASEG